MRHAGLLGLTTGALVLSAAGAARADDGGQLNSAPLVAPLGRFAIEGTLPIYAFQSNSVDAQGNITSNTSTLVGLDVDGTYGIADKLQVGGSYNFTLKDFDGTGIIGVHGAFSALHTDVLDFALAANLSFDLHSGGEALLSVGGWARLHLGPTLSVFTGNPGLPNSTPLGGQNIFGLLGFSGSYQLALGLNNGQGAVLALPVGVGLQTSPNLFVYASTTLADVELHGSGGSLVFGSDLIPVNVGAFAKITDLGDLGVSFSDDLKHAGDFYQFAVTARIWLH